MTAQRAILMLSAAAILAAAAISAAGDEAATAPADGQASITVARQLMLKYRIQKINDGTLTASLRRNRQQWEQLAPAERDKYRRDALAFLRQSRREQKKLLEQYDALSRLSESKQVAYRGRAGWLKAVVDSYSLAQQDQLRTLAPQTRARQLIERRDELIRQGKLQLDADDLDPATGRT